MSSKGASHACSSLRPTNPSNSKKKIDAQWAYGIGRSRHDRHGRTDLRRGSSVRSDGIVSTMLLCSANDISAICSIPTKNFTRGPYASIAAQGRADPTGRSDHRSHAGGAGFGRTAPSIFQSVGFRQRQGPPRQLWRIRPESTSHARDIAERSAVFASVRSASGSLCISLSPVRTAFRGGNTRKNGRQQL
jgi:hypothetical protein